MRRATESERVAPELTAWRRDQLVRSGFTLPLADSLARDARYDLHGLIELVERGCEPTLATRILAPDDREDVA